MGNFQKLVENLEDLYKKGLLGIFKKEHKALFDSLSELLDSDDRIVIRTTRVHDASFAYDVASMLEESSKVRGIGISKRSPEYLARKIQEGNAVIALYNGSVIGFCYMEIWEEGKYVANSGLIVHPDYRGKGLAKRIKTKIFNLSREKFPNSKIFGITTSPATIKINSELGYEPVMFSDLTSDKEFWDGCQSCPNYDILTRMERKNCLCVGMLYEPKLEK